MPGVVRLGDRDDETPINRMVEGSPNVFVNGVKVCRLGDKDSDTDKTVTGSASVFVNGLAITRIGDIDSDNPPNVKIEGSTDVFAE